jgi:hypothetical protein
MTIHNTIESLIAAQLTKPITHHVVTTWSDGETLTHPTTSDSAAENWAIGERRKIGREVTRRKFPNGRARIISVEVVAL